MKEKHSYPIRHISIDDLLQSGIPDGTAQEYKVYWWQEIPLGHTWPETGAAPSTHIADVMREVWKCISPAVRFYCDKSGQVAFSRLAEAWESQAYETCRQLLNQIFQPYTLPPPGYVSDLSLVICTRNRPEHLKYCLEALARLSVMPREVIVVDNAPDNDDTKNIVLSFPDITYVLEPEKGLDRARNTGWRHASSSIVAYSDDDVQLHKNWVWQTEQAFDHPRIKAVTGLVLARQLDSKAQILFERYWSFNRGYEDIEYDTAYFKKYVARGVPAWDVGAGANMAFRRAALDTTGGFDDRLDVGASGCSGDSEMWYRLMAEGWTIHYTPRAIAYHTHRKEMKALKQQLFYYLRGSASSLLVQYQRSGHRGNLYYLFRTLPEYYARSLYHRFRYPRASRYLTIFNEMGGVIAGVRYFLQHKHFTENKEVVNKMSPGSGEALVSVIITAYNHARYITDAIESVLRQTHADVELVVVDDGSTDDTRAVATAFPEVKYVYQQNKGLSAARNNGVSHCTGNYVVFLDADDVLYPNAVADNLRYFHQNPESVFVSGGHDRVDEQLKLVHTDESSPPESAHFMALLQGNYIGMHAAVMYRREVFDYFLFDETLAACEDYDLYLRLAKKYPVFSHTRKLAAYRQHGDNMSSDINLMLGQVTHVLRKNTGAKDRAVSEARKRGVRNWKAYYARTAYRQMAYRYLYPGYRVNLHDVFFVTRVLPWQMAKYAGYKLKSKTTHSITSNTSRMKDKIKALLGRRGPDNIPPKGHVDLGDLRRTSPISKQFGYDRGGPVDRYYIEHFLAENKDDVKGNVLEVGDNAYTMAYGGDRVYKSDILYVDDSNPQATIIGDLSTGDHIPANTFDCIVLTQTLHLIYDFHSAVRHCYRILKPGGVLLLTVPGITQIDYGEWGDTWYWAFTGKAIQKLLAESFNPADVLVQTHGNVLAATAFLYGLGQEEITKRERDDHDPHYQVIITARAVKKIETV